MRRLRRVVRASAAKVVGRALNGTEQRRRRMCERMEAWMGARRTARRRFARHVGSLIGVSMLMALGVAPAVAWGDGGGDEQAKGKPTSVTPAEGCPGDVVTFHGTGFATGGSRTRVRWNDFKAGEAQFGSPESTLFVQSTQ